MQFIFQYPDFHGIDGDMLDAGPVGELAVTAERAGWKGFAFTEHPAPSAKWLVTGGHQSLDPFVALSHVAAVTTELKLLTYLAVLPYRNPAASAKSAATVDKLSNGRFILGVGTGYLKAEYFALGVDFDERNVLFDEALDVLPLHWSGEPFDYDGSHFSCRGIIGRPRPVQQPIPIWIGGNAKLTLRRVAERAQGWMPLTGPAGMFSTVRSPEVSSTDDIVERLQMLKDLAGDRFAALDITIAYTDRSVYDLASDVERHRDALGALRELGATWVVVPGPEHPHPQAEEFLQGFAETYF
ncbi:MAG: LLM class F420-dependent oxidoreductase [Acidimicrobiia bacterium]